MVEQIRNEPLIQAGDRVLVAVSGGPDSLALLAALQEARRVLGVRELRVAHVNHGLRGRAAGADARFVARHCEARKIPCDVVNVRVPAESAKKLGVEAAARATRYLALQEIARTRRCNVLAVAHHADDVAETVLWRILRGTSVDGLAAMPSSRKLAPGLLLVRPLLSQTRDEIERYLGSLRIKPRRDATNLRDDFLRNRIRNRLLPFLERNIQPGSRRALVRLAQAAREDAEALARYADAAWRASTQKNRESVKLRLRSIVRLPKAILARLIRRAIAELEGPVGLLERTHYDAAVRAFLDDRGGADLPGGFRVDVRSGIALIRRVRRG